MTDFSPKNSKTICIAFPDKEYYQKCMEDAKIFRKFLNETYERYPELFPAGFIKGFRLHSFITSKKQKGFIMRRIELNTVRENVWQIHPSFMMPYMISETEQVEKALFLRRRGVPFDALSYVFDRNAMFWYNAYVSPGRHSIVGTTVRDPGPLPVHLPADEKHTRRKGKESYVTTTASRGCIPGIGLAENPGTEALTEGYRDFQKEVQVLNPDYRPGTVNTDGWEATQKAWKKLFPSVIIILCFLRSFLRIRDRCRRSREILRKVGEKIWNVYYSETIAQSAQRIRRLREWNQKQEEAEPVRIKIAELCGKGSLFKAFFSAPGAYRTGNMTDRLMNYQDRVLYAMQYFHGSHKSSLLYLRSMAPVWNFHPYGTKTVGKNPDRFSPFEDLNGFRYHDNRLQNMLIAGSMGGIKCDHKIL